MRALHLALALLLLTAPAAAAKSGVELSTPPDGLRAGQPWVVDLTPIRGERPVPMPGNVPVTVEIEKVGTGERHVVRASPLGNGTFRARVVFSSGGRWVYQVTGFGSDRQEWPPATILPAEPAGASDSAAQESAGGFPFGWVVAGLAAVAIGSAALVMRRRRS
ncbi:MAG: hypothetical protein ACJ76K_10585 [Solirubrobacteraceae bacterium]|jgi:hypothetical protein